MILEINGKQVEVDDSFQTMTPEQQGAMVDDIASQIGAAPVAQPQTVAQPQATGGLLNMLGTPSAMPNATADLAPPRQDFGANTSSLFVDPATLNVPAQTPEQAIEGTNALKRDIRISQNPDISEDYKLQELAKAPTDLLGAPQDAMTMIANANLWGLDKLAEGAGYLTGNDLNVDYRVPIDLPGSSDWLNVKKNEGIDSAANLLAQLTGNEPLREGETLAIPPEDVSPQDRMLGAGLRFGAGGALGGGIAAGTKTALAAPYAVNASKALMGDTLAGGGSGVVQEAYQNYIPEPVKEALGPIGDIIAALVGGVGGGTANVAGHAVAEGTKNVVKDSKTFSPFFTDKSTPIDPNTGRQYRPSEVDMAARIAQNMPSDLKKTKANINQSKAEFDFATAGEQPTTGMRSNDVGMSMAENAARSKDPERFKNQDNRREALATKKIESVAPADANARDMTNTASDLYWNERNAAEQKVKDAEAALELGGADITKQNLELEEARARQNQSSEALSKETLAKRQADTDTKNSLYREVPDDTPVDANSLYTELKAIEESVPRAARAGTEYASSAKRIGDLIYEKDPMTGNVTLKDLTYGDLNVVNNELKAARQEAIKGYRDVTHLDKLRDLVQGRLREMNPKAADYYANEFAPKWRTGKMGEYDRMLKSAVKTGGESSATRPSEMAGKFLGKPEDAASLQRAVDVNGSPVTAENATQWMLGDLAKSGVTNAKGALRYDKVKQWAAKNKDVIDQFPEVRKRIDAEIARAEQGGKFSKQLADEVKAAADSFTDTKNTLEHSALQHAIGKNPENAVDSIMRSGDPEVQMADMVERLNKTQSVDAIKGLKAATRNWIKNEVDTTAHLVGQDGTRKTSRAALEKLFKKHEKTLSKVYDETEMNTLRQAHKLLDVAANLDVQARPGSDTASKIDDRLNSFFTANSAKRKANMRMFEVAAKLRYGMLKGGGITRTVGLMLDSLGNMSTKPQAVENIIMEMMFNPDLAAHLLTKNVKEIGTPAWNKKLNFYLGIASGARDDKLEGDE